METVNIPESRALKEKVNRSLLFITVGTIVMLFAAFTSAYILRRADSGWQGVQIPFMFWVSTGIILLSSITMNWAVTSVKKNALSNLKIALGLTLALGFAFCVTQFIGWKHLTENGIFLTGQTADPAGSYVYVLSGVHLLHIISGLIYLIIVWAKSLKNIYNSGNSMGVRHAGIYWHFLDALWIYLFVFMLLFR